MISCIVVRLTQFKLGHSSSGYIFVVHTGIYEVSKLRRTMHRSSGLTASEVKDKYTVSWDNIAPLEEWLRTQPTEKWKEDWDQNGVLVVEKLLNQEEVTVYRDVYQKILDGEIDTTSHRHDLGNHEEKRQDAENICQVMWPSLFINNIFEGPMHSRALQVAKIIMGNDAEFDFDMLLSKAPHTSTPTPWHQDESYWLDMPDKRAASCWCAIDDADMDNGCMWFSPGSHKKPLWPHRPVKPGVHVLMCEATEDVGKPYPLPAGSCTFHHGRMLHYSRGNTTDRQRRAYVTNFRPREMIEFERKNNYDHGKDLGTKEIIGTGQTHESN